jgi:hypothetical protein
VNPPYDGSTLAFDVSGNAQFSNFSYMNNIIQSFQTVTWDTTVVLDYRNTSIFYLGGTVTSNFTINIHWLPTLADAARLFTVKLIYIPSGYYCNNVTFSVIDSSANSAVAILNGSAPSNNTLVVQEITLFCDISITNNTYALMDIKKYT